MKTPNRKRTLSFCSSESVADRVRDFAQENGVNVSRYLNELVCGHLNERSTIGDVDALRAITVRLQSIEDRLTARIVSFEKAISELQTQSLGVQAQSAILNESITAFFTRVEHLISSTHLDSIIQKSPYKQSVKRDKAQPETGSLF